MKKKKVFFISFYQGMVSIGGISLSHEITPTVFFRESDKSKLLRLRIPLKAAEMFFFIVARGCSAYPGRGIMSTILTLNYSDSCCSCCLKTVLWIKHKDQARIRKKPLTSAETPLCCSTLSTAQITLSSPPPSSM